VNARSPMLPGAYHLLTGSSPAAIAVVRVHGAKAATFIEQHIRVTRRRSETTWVPGRVWRAELLDTDGLVIDDMLISVHAPPPSWDVRLHLHGNPWLLRQCEQLLQSCGLRPECDESTSLWALPNVLEDEACAVLPRMLTPRGGHWLLQQAERLRAAIRPLIDTPSGSDARDTCREIASRSEIVEWFARSLRVALVGFPNAGKSTLANALADRPVSVVSPTPGTTRDWVEVPGEAAGFPVVWLDTAGLRAGSDPLERASVARTEQLMQDADTVVVVLDSSVEVPRSFLAAYGPIQPVCVALSKSDLCETPGLMADLPAHWRSRAVPVSAMERTGLEALQQAAVNGVGRSVDALDLPAAFTPRQVDLLEQAARTTDHKTTRARLLQLLGSSPTGAAGTAPAGCELGPSTDSILG